MSNANSNFYARTTVIAVTLVIAILCLQILKPFTTALAWALAIAFLLAPVKTWLQHRLGKRAHHTTWLLTIAASIAILAPLVWISSLFVAQASALLQQVQGQLNRDELQHLAEQPWLQRALAWLHDAFGITTTQLHTWITDATHSLLQLIAALGGKVFMGTLGTLGNLFLMLFLLFFFIRDGERMVAVLRQLVPMNSSARDELFAHLSAVTRAVMVGTGLTALIQGALVGAAFLFTGLPSPVVFGVLAMLLALLPLGGTAFVWVPAAVVLFAQQRWGAGAFMLLWGALLVSMIDNFLKPMLISGRAEVATLTIFLGVLGGVAAFGAIGLIIGPVILALALALIRFAVAHREAAGTSE